MISTKKHIGQLAAILLSKGINDIILSPGSRNGPLIHTFAGSGLFHCLSIADERSAAYFAIGLAQGRRRPVVLVCTSGTAALNYGPGIAEAFYLNVPLIVLTADRPPWWLGQAESQCIHQTHLYRDFTKKEVTLPLGESEEELWYAGRLINECVNLSVSGNPGPVHLNIPLEEPLHELTAHALPPAQVIETAPVQSVIADEEFERLTSAFNKAGQVMIVAGQQFPDAALENDLAELAARSGVVVLREHLSNLNHPRFCGNIDLLMPTLKKENRKTYRPELLISFGGQLVSKSLKQFLRKNKPDAHWHLTLSNEHVDTYQSLTKVICQNAGSFFNRLLNKAVAKDHTYLQRWKEKEQEVVRKRDQFIAQAEFCDLKVFRLIGKAIPPESVIHPGNSSPVRYALMDNAVRGALYMGNRGTAGIDGVLSTAAGFAFSSEKLNTVILGDLSFFYDSNALWNHYVKKNLRVVVINNRGGNIFGMIKGTDQSPAFETYFLTENTITADGIAKTFGLDYFQAANEEELDAGLQRLYSSRRGRAALLEVFTDAAVNSRVFRELFSTVGGNGERKQKKETGSSEF